MQLLHDTKSFAKQYLSVWLLAFSILASCSDDKTNSNPEPVRSLDIRTTEGGLRYMHCESMPGPKPEPYQCVLMDIQFLAPNGEIIFTTYSIGGALSEPIGQRLIPGGAPGDVIEALRLLSAGDSMVIYQPAAIALPDKEVRPKTIKDTDEIRMCLRVHKIMSFEAFVAFDKQRKEVKTASHHEREPEIIRKNVVINELQDSVFELPNNLFFMIQREGKGPFAQDGDSIIMHYNTRLLNGLTIDDSQKMQGKPFGFVFDRTNPKRGLIPAWETIFSSILNKGAVGVFWAPSHLCFGSSRKQNLGEYQSLQFQFFILDIVPKDKIKSYKKNYANMDGLLEPEKAAK